MSAPPPSPSLVLTFEDARRLVEEHAMKLSASNTETVDLLHAPGRVLAESIAADRDLPPLPRSTRDGYAVRSTDLAHPPTKLSVIGELKAGASSGSITSLNAGQTFSIMTGAPVPPGADAVVMVEYTTPRGGFVEITSTVTAGENIVAQAAEAQSESVVLEPGTRLNEASIALAASVGKSQLEVFLRPCVAVLTTGDEIVEVDSQPGLTQIRNSNAYSLAAQIQHAGGDPVLLAIAPDEPLRLRQLIEQGLQSDLLLMTGGVSMGRYDLVEQVLSEMKADFLFTGAKIQPGKPVVFGKCGPGAPFDRPSAGSARQASAPKYFFGLPGNPVSTMVTFELFARPILQALAGMPPRPLLFLHARLKSDLHFKIGLRRFLPAILSGRYEESHVELLPWQGSGDIAAQSRSNCLLVIPPDREHFKAGEWIPVMPR